MADAFRAFAVLKFNMQLDFLLLREFLLLELELGREIKQAEFLLLLGNDFIEKGQVIAEEENGCGIIDLGVFPDVVLKEDCSHRRDVLVAEPQVGASKTCVAGFDGRNTNFSLLVQHMARKDLFGHSHRARTCLDWRQKDFPLHARYVERKQSTTFDHLACDFVLASRELTQRNLFPSTNLVK